MRRLIGITIVWTLVACGPRHGEAKPDTHKVQGKVVYKDGKPYADGGQIEFHHVEKAGVSARGEIGKDGSFVLHTMTAQQKYAGAVEGTYAVKVMVIAPDQSMKLTELKKKHAIAKGDNKLTIAIDD